MKKKYKIFLTLILTLIFLQTKPVSAVVNVTPGGAAAPESGGCSECSWVYVTKGVGVRLSLYKYDGKNLTFVTLN